MSEPDQRIVITGIGLATIFGLGREVTWRAVAAGRSGLSEAPALIPDEDDTADGMSPIEVETLRAVAREAIQQAGLADPAGRRMGVVIGTTLHGIRGAGRYLRTGDAARLGEVPAARVVRDAFQGLGIGGPRLTTCSACASGLASVAMGVTLLRTGVLDVAIVGGYDPLAEYSSGGFASLRLVASGLPRPFCRERDGLRLGPGYAALVLERASDVASRGGQALAEALGWGETSDAFHLTRPHPEGLGAAAAMREALQRAGLDGQGVDLISAHATGTPANDAAEYGAMRAVLGESLATTPVVAFKGHLGHTLGAAGAVELALSLLSMREGLAPPTPGVTPADVEFEGLDLVTGEGRRTRIRTTMNLSIGFGGSNACVVLGTPGAGAPSRPRNVETDVAITGIGMIAPGAMSNEQVLALARSRRLAGGPIAPEELEPLVAEHRLRRQSEYSRLTIAAASLAMDDAQIHDRAAFAHECGAVLGTAHGSAGFSEAYYREIVACGPQAGNPMLFAEGVPNAGAAQLSIVLGVTGGCQTIVGSRTSGLEALALAAQRVRCGAWRRAIVGAAEEFSETVNSAYQACGLTGSGGFVAAAGAGAVILERVDDAQARGGRALATVGRFGLAFAETPDAGAFEDAIGRVLDDADAGGAVVGSANGTWIDDMERLAVRRRLGDGRYVSMRTWLAEMFAAGPLIRLGVALSAPPPLKTSDDRITALCIDPLGPVAAVSVQRA